MQLRVLSFVLAGGKGTRLYPLTKERAKPAVPFGGQYRIIDFVLSNLVNSGIHSIYVLIQFKSQSLLQHLRDGWEFSGILEGSVHYSRAGADAFAGRDLVSGYRGCDLPEREPD
ncbi:MAG: sugar phosphate nucleotidyltransferase [Pirellulales bacterium]